MNIDYSSGVVKEHLQDPNLFSQQRCEFKLPNHMNVLSNMKLANLNATRTGGDDCDYSRGCGAVSLLKRLVLMDGANILSECREVGKQATFRNFNNPNNVNNSMKTPHLKGTIGFNYGQSQSGADPNVFNSYEGRKYDSDLAQVTDTVSSNGVLVLSDLLPILNHVELLDNAVFKDGLRLVIEWESDVRKMVTKNNVTLTINQPILCYYTVEDESLYNELKLGAGMVNWYEREIDTRPYLSANFPSQTQVFNGFDSKRVLRIAVVKETQNNATLDNGVEVKGVGKNGSDAFVNEKFNVINNGAQVFPEDLDYQDIQRQVVNAFGDCSAYLGSYLRRGNQANNSNPNFSKLIANDSVRAGGLSYCAASLGNEMVKNLQIKLENPNVAVAVGNGIGDNYSVSVMGDVAKMMSVDASGNYTIGYS